MSWSGWLPVGFVGRGRAAAQARVEADGIASAFDVAEARHARFGMGREPAAAEQLGFQGGEEALGHGVVVSVADRTHRGADTGLAAPFAERQRRMLRSLVAVTDNVFGPLLADSPLKRVQHQLGPQMVRPAKPRSGLRGTSRPPRTDAARLACGSRRPARQPSTGTPPQSAGRSCLRPQAKPLLCLHQTEGGSGRHPGPCQGMEHTQVRAWPGLRRRPAWHHRRLARAALRGRHGRPPARPGRDCGLQQRARFQ